MLQGHARRQEHHCVCCALLDQLNPPDFMLCCSPPPSLSPPPHHQVIEINKPLLKFDHATKEMPAHGSNIEKRIDIQMKDITLPQIMKDKTSKWQLVFLFFASLSCSGITWMIRGLVCW
jgi:hypothetical protein